MDGPAKGRPQTSFRKGNEDGRVSTGSRLAGSTLGQRLPLDKSNHQEGHNFRLLPQMWPKTWKARAETVPAKMVSGMT